VTDPIAGLVAQGNSGADHRRRHRIGRACRTATAHAVPPPPRRIDPRPSVAPALEEPSRAIGAQRRAVGGYGSNKDLTGADRRSRPHHASAQQSAPLSHTRIRSTRPSPSSSKVTLSAPRPLALALGRTGIDALCPWRNRRCCRRRRWPCQQPFLVQAWSRGRQRRFVRVLSRESLRGRRLCGVYRMFGYSG